MLNVQVKDGEQQRSTEGEVPKAPTPKPAVAFNSLSGGIKLPVEVSRKNLWFKLTRVANEGHTLTINADASLEEMEAEWSRISEERG